MLGTWTAVSQARNPEPKCRGARGAPGHLVKQGSQNPSGESQEAVIRTHLLVPACEETSGLRARGSDQQKLRDCSWSARPFSPGRSSDRQTDPFGSKKVEEGTFH